ncbi:MAG TPA: C4-type zinc ribbon domain-containing protein, partial [Acidimicrobiales bacterium]
LDEHAAGVRARLAEAQAAIDGELASEVAARAEAAQDVPAEVMSSYERLRARLDGVGISRLVNGRCDGCHLSLSVTELSNAARLPPDAVLHCEQCGRILVR